MLHACAWMICEIGVKSQSNLAMACSYRIMPQYSFVEFVNEVKYGLSSQSLLATELLSNSEHVDCVTTGLGGGA